MTSTRGIISRKVPLFSPISGIVVSSDFKTSQLDMTDHISTRKMSHDPNRYKDPMKFNPDRHLGPNAEADPMEFVFGFGR